MTRSCSNSPFSAVFCRYTRLSMTIGADLPPYGTFHARFCPAGDHDVGKPFSGETPSRFGPRHSVQSFAITGVSKKIERVRFKKMDLVLIFGFRFGLCVI